MWRVHVCVGAYNFRLLCETECLCFILAWTFHASFLILRTRSFTNCNHPISNWLLHSKVLIKESNRKLKLNGLGVLLAISRRGHTSVL